MMPMYTNMSANSPPGGTPTARIRFHVEVRGFTMLASNVTYRSRRLK